VTAGFTGGHVNLEPVLSVVPVTAIAAAKWPKYDRHKMISKL